MLEGRKYILGLNCGIIFGKTKCNVPYALPDADYSDKTIGMLVHLEDVEIDPLILMDKKQAKELIKALRRGMRDAKRKK